MKPFRAFLFFLLVLISFLLIYFLKDYRHKAPRESSFQQNEPSDSIAFIPETKVEKSDSTVISEALKDTFTEISTEESIKLLNPVPFEFSPNDSSGFASFFKKLANIENEKLPVRIIYFGDSQIESDRITSTLRKHFQTKFGGKGLGFVPVDHLYNAGHQLIMELSKDWKVASVQDKDFKNNSLLFKNTVFDDKNSRGWFSLKRIKSLGPQPDYRLMKLYYQLNGQCTLDVESSKETIYTGELPNDGVLRVQDFKFNRTPSDIKLNFSTNGLLKILGISLETKGGVLVDNIALRGLSYPTFEWSDKEAVKTMIGQINPGLFIFHFGVNLVPYESDDYFYFRKHFKQQILFLKDHYPDAPLLIIGVSDMARKHKGKFESYTNIHQIKKIQKEIAFETGAVFWDLEAFMGGKSGMIRWVNAEPKLGRKDYVHFSKKGAEKIGLELFKMILEEFEKDTTIVR